MGGVSKNGDAPFHTQYINIEIQEVTWRAQGGGRDMAPCGMIGAHICPYGAIWHDRCTYMPMWPNMVPYGHIHTYIYLFISLSIYITISLYIYALSHICQHGQYVMPYGQSNMANPTCHMASHGPIWTHMAEMTHVASCWANPHDFQMWLPPHTAPYGTYGCQSIGDNEHYSNIFLSMNNLFLNGAPG